jgi:hypothetical protein
MIAKTWTIFWLFLLLAPAIGMASDWEIDEAMRFHLAYIPDGANLPSTEAKSVSSLGLTADYLPDIDNIQLAAIQGLGFYLPAREEPAAYKLYLKLFTFPACLRPEASAGLALQAFALSQLADGDKIKTFVSKADNLAVKFGYIEKAERSFTATNPFPRLLVDEGDTFAKNFNEHVLFYSLYVTPKPIATLFSSTDEQALFSAQGVVAFHQEVVALYQRIFEATSGAQSGQFFYFRDRQSQAMYKVPKNPMVFANWRDLPMPSDPQHHFLSGLLLIYREEAGKGTVFEVGSVVRIAGKLNKKGRQ